MSALADWLDSHGLGALHTILAAQQIDIDVLPDLTEDDLKGLGIALGPRRRLLKAIAGDFAAPPPPSDANPAVDSAERRQLSVLFVDLVGSHHATRSGRDAPDRQALPECGGRRGSTLRRLCREVHG
jgi:hypothetical protein